MSSSVPAAAVLFLAVLSLLSACASARPGLFVGYTITTTALSDDALPGLHRASVFISVYRIIAPIRTIHPDPRPARIPRPSLLPRREVVPVEPAALSLHERAKDVLVVVIGLLFGVGCGAIIAATMCLAWSLVTHRHEICGFDEYSDEEEGADESPKKSGFHKVPAADPVSVKEGLCRSSRTPVCSFLTCFIFPEIILEPLTDTRVGMWKITSDYYEDQ